MEKRTGKETKKITSYEASDFFFMLSLLDDRESTLDAFEIALSDTPHLDDAERYTQLFIETFTKELIRAAVFNNYRYSEALIEILLKDKWSTAL